MENLIALIEQYGYWIIFLGVLADTLGLPVPGEVVLLIGGSLVFAHKLNLGLVLVLAVAAALTGDSLLYWLGRKINERRERRLIALYCRWSYCTIGSAYCHNAARSYVANFRERILLVAKFILGVRQFIPPVAGMARVSFLPFVMLDGLGSLAWAGTFAAVGYLLHEQLAAVISRIERLGTMFSLLIVSLIFLFFFWKAFKVWRSGNVSPNEIENSERVLRFSAESDDAAK